MRALRMGVGGGGGESCCIAVVSVFPLPPFRRRPRRALLGLPNRSGRIATPRPPPSPFSPFPSSCPPATFECRYLVIHHRPRRRVARHRSTSRFHRSLVRKRVGRVTKGFLFFGLLWLWSSWGIDWAGGNDGGSLTDRKACTTEAAEQLQRKRGRGGRRVVRLLAGVGPGGRQKEHKAM